MIVKVTKLLLLLLCWPLVNLAQPNSSGADARGRAHFIYHPKSKAMLLIDGYANHLDSPHNNVWNWDGKRWRNIEAIGPDSRCGNAAALDKKSGNVVTFGGWGKGGPATDSRNDVWQFDGKQWRKLPTNFIDKHDHHKMVFADHLNAFVVYGGRNATTGMPDSATWLLKDGHFTALYLAGPGARGNIGFAYDPHRKKVVLFGGKKFDVPADLWEFDGTAWKQIEVADIGMTTGMQMAYSDDLRRVVVHGTSGTWTWDGKIMTRIANGGPNGSNIAFGYDHNRKVFVAYGGLHADNSVSSALWELKQGQWKKISDNGIWKNLGSGKYERVSPEIPE